MGFNSGFKGLNTGTTSKPNSKSYQYLKHKVLCITSIKPDSAVQKILHYKTKLLMPFKEILYFYALSHCGGKEKPIKFFAYVRLSDCPSVRLSACISAASHWTDLREMRNEEFYEKLSRNSRIS